MTTVSDDARYAELRTEVRGLGKDYDDLKGIVLGLDRKIDSSNQALTAKLDLMVTGIGTRFETAISGINQTLSEKSKPQWTVLIGFAAVLLTVGGMVASMGYLIVKGTTDHLESDVRRIDLTNNQQVGRGEFDTARININQAIRDMREVNVQKDHFEARWKQHEDSRKDLQERVTAIALRNERAIDRLTDRLNSLLEKRMGVPQ